MPIEAFLTRPDLERARAIGERRFGHVRDRSKPRFAYEGRSGLDTHVRGAEAELAFAKALGLDWPERVDTFRSLPDVDPFWEVRWSSRYDRPKVAVDDPAHYLVAHVTGRPPAFEVHGYVVAAWAQTHTPAIDLPDQYGQPRGWKAHWPKLGDLSPIDEHFHDVCAFARDYGDYAGWVCIYCGRTS